MNINYKLWTRLPVYRDSKQTRSSAKINTLYHSISDIKSEESSSGLFPKFKSKRKTKPPIKFNTEPAQEIKKVHAIPVPSSPRGQVIVAKNANNIDDKSNDEFSTSFF